MNPRAAEIAMEQMRRMTPEQMAHMQRQMGNVTPEMMQQAMRQMGNMGAQDWDRVAARMDGMDPSTLTDMAGDATSQFRAQQEYIYKGSLQLKAEGNKLHSAGRYSEAIEKYLKAKNNMASRSDQNSRTLWKACTLNLAFCHLKLSQFPQCVEQCSEVLGGEPENLKALYRRGEAYRGLERFSLAASDLKQALQLSKGDPAQESSIREKLEAVQEALAKSPGVEDGDVEEVEEIPSAWEQDSSAHAPRPGIIIEEVTDDEPSASQSQGGSSIPRGPTGAGIPATDVPQMEQAADMFRSNPNLMKQTAQMMANMPDEQLAALSKASGLNMSPEMVRSAHAAMEHMTPDMMEQMASVASSMPHRTAGSASTTPTPEAGPDPTQMLEPEQLEQWAKMCKENPEFIKNQFEKLSNMSEEELKEMARLRGFPEGYNMSPELARNAAKSMSEMTPEELANVAAQYNLFKEPGAASSVHSQDVLQGAQRAPPSSKTPEAMGGASAEQPAPIGGMAAGPGGMKFTPEMMRSATEMMAKMTPDQLSEMTRMASQMSSAGVPSLSDAQTPMGMMGGMGSMGAMLDDPEAVKSMAKMMQSMDEGALADMCMSSGMAKTREQAEDMAQKMKQMSPGQVEMMVKATAYLQKGVKAAKNAKDFLMGRAALVIAILVIVVGVILRYLGYM